MCTRALCHVQGQADEAFLNGVGWYCVCVFGRLCGGGVLQGLHNRTGFLFFVVTYFSLLSLSSIAVLYNEKLSFQRERAAGGCCVLSACMTTCVEAASLSGAL